ncbi:elongin-A [Schizosaccharomyces japonicus yFS275]|uniref:Elongin-A n=1 Tax=Schizosaccharomyces japonicus (strain yFS275 / FY16936) TaxID=402676 RepID=B6JVX5_SCHJY|nr:elongin-A [Schizosaccharomyces japonicus yFS275]EEB05526.1 elongin-A [Schizosaccharomyces japonicus yFS275]
MTVPSLQDLCVKVAQRYVQDIEDLGDHPFSLVEPILACARPDHLIRLEQNSPHLRDDTQGLWKVHVYREFGLDITDQDTSNIQDWRRAYEDFKKRRNAQYNLASKKLRSAYTKLEQNKQHKRIVSLEFDPKSIQQRKRGRTVLPTYTPTSSLMNRAKCDFMKKASMYRQGKPNKPLSSTFRFPSSRPTGTTCPVPATPQASVIRPPVSKLRPEKQNVLPKRQSSPPRPVLPRHNPTSAPRIP